MRYLDEMVSKYGFGDGSSIPPDASARREVYVKIINNLAKEYKSEYRIQAYDRDGMHNGCMVIFTKDGDPRFNFLLLEVDEAMKTAVDKAIDMDVDQCVYATVHTDEELVTRLLEEK